jgi:hypothetical protein
LTIDATSAGVSSPAGPPGPDPGAPGDEAEVVTFSQSLSTMSILSASTVSVPKPQLMLSTSPSRASTWSLP